jgi:hypothetical protein
LLKAEQGPRTRKHATMVEDRLLSGLIEASDDGADPTGRIAKQTSDLIWSVTLLYQPQNVPMRALDSIAHAAIAVVKLFCCQFGVHRYSFCHAFIIHHLNGFDITRFHLHTIVRLPAGVFSPYTTILTNILFFEADQEQLYSEVNPCTKEVWFYEILLPPGRRSYTKTRPIPYEAFQPCINWWDNRVENEHAWKIPIEQILANDCKLDYQNPHHS